MLLGPLRGKRTVWAACLFADPIADIAVLGQPDNQELSKEAEAYNRLMEDMATLTVGHAPALRSETLTFGERHFENIVRGKGPARVLSLRGVGVRAMSRATPTVRCSLSLESSSSEACRDRPLSIRLVQRSALPRQHRKD